MLLTKRYINDILIKIIYMINIIKLPFEILYAVYGTIVQLLLISKILKNHKPFFFKKSVTTEEYWEGYFAYYRNGFDYLFKTREAISLRQKWQRAPQWHD